jgi:hypothetical protein
MMPAEAINFDATVKTGIRRHGSQCRRRFWKVVIPDMLTNSVQFFGLQGLPR